MTTPTTTTRTDEHIQVDVLDELKWDARVQATQIGVIVKDGVVTLTGTVDSYWKRWAAAEAAHAVRTVQAVANEITVALPSSTVRTDADLAEAVLYALKWDTSIPDHKLDITVTNGVITLNGEVPYYYQRYDAERAILRIEGVQDVANFITVKPHRVNHTIKQDIERALARNFETDARNITVEVHGNNVIMKGTVNTYAEREAAWRTAWHTQGVSNIDEQITVSSSR
jgi:osmotically-inducible protein OsmY